MTTAMRDAIDDKIVIPSVRLAVQMDIFVPEKEVWALHKVAYSQEASGAV